MPIFIYIPIKLAVQSIFFLHSPHLFPQTNLLMFFCFTPIAVARLTVNLFIESFID